MNIQRIVEIVCKESQLSTETIQVNNRRREIVKPRQACHYFARQFTALTEQTIGELIGNKDRCTVIHSVKTVSNLMDTDRNYKDWMRRIENNLMIEALKGIRPKLTMSTYEERKEMTPKQLATMFSGLKIPVADMEKMIEDYRMDELEKFRQYLNAKVLASALNDRVIESYLNSKPQHESCPFCESEDITIVMLSHYKCKSCNEKWDK